MSTVSSSTAPMVVDFRDRDQYTIQDSTSQGERAARERSVNEAQLNGILAPYGVQVADGQFRAVDGYSITSTNAAVATTFGDAPPLPNVAGPTNQGALTSRIRAMQDGGEGALMWLAMSELAYTAIRDMKDAKDVKRLMQSNMIEAKQAAITSTENQIAAERAEANRAFKDAVVTAVVICAVSCAVAGATSGASSGASAGTSTGTTTGQVAGTGANAVGGTANSTPAAASNSGSSVWGKAADGVATSLPSALGTVYSTYATAESKNNGPQREADEAKLKAMRWEAQAEMMNQMVEEAQSNYEEAKELFKLALKILADHGELVTQATQTTTRG